MTTAPATAALTKPGRRRPVTNRGRRVFYWIAEHALLVALGILFIAPVVFVTLTSFMSSTQTLTASLWPQPWQWQNYVTAFTEVPLARWFSNSLLYSVLATVFMLVSSVPAAYALAKIRFRGSGTLFTVIIVAMLLPPQVTAIPIYVMWAEAGLTGTLWPLILPNLLGDAFSIFLLRQFFLTIPSNYADAARIDGCGEFGVLWRVVLPMAKPGIAATAIFMFFHSWNDYFGPLLYTSENAANWPVAYGLASFRGVHGTDWGLTMAMTLLVTIPVVVVFFFAQRVFVEGITLTGVKG